MGDDDAVVIGMSAAAEASPSARARGAGVGAAGRAAKRGAGESGKEQTARERTCISLMSDDDDDEVQLVGGGGGGGREKRNDVGAGASAECRRSEAHNSSDAVPVDVRLLTEGLTESLSEDQERIRTLEERIHQLEGSNRELGARNSKLQLELSRAKHRLVQVRLYFPLPCFLVLPLHPRFLLSSPPP
jgi:hypothetical protein